MSRRRSEALDRAGFALPTVLTMVAILTLIFLTCILALHDLFVETMAAGDQAEFERAAFSAEGRFTWLAATEPLSVNALLVGAARQGVDRDIPSSIVGPTRDTISELRLDGRPYTLSFNNDARTYLVSAQDSGGLLNLNRQPTDVLIRLFLKAGVEQGLAEQLADELQDFIDTDSLRRLKGAEAEDYLRAGRPPPPDRPLYSMAQLKGLLSWNRLTAAQKKKVMEIATAQVDSDAGNINTMTADAMEAFFNLQPNDAKRIIETRELTPIYDLPMVGLQPPDDTRRFTFPDGRFRFRVTDPVRGFAYQSEITLTAIDIDRPVWIEHGDAQRTDLNGAVRFDKLPAFPTVGSDSDNGR